MGKITCPYCGRDVGVVYDPVGSYGGESRALVPMGDRLSSSPWADAAPMGPSMGMPAFTEATQRRPARAAEPGSDVVVPLLQSLVSASIALAFGVALALFGSVDAWLVIGLAGGLAAFVALRVFAGIVDRLAAVVVICIVCGVAGWNVDGPIEIPFFFPFVAFLAVLAAVWTWRLVAHSQSLWVHQRIVNEVPPAPPAPVGPASYTVHGEFKDEQGAMQMDDFPEPKDKPGALRCFAQAIDGKRAHFCEADAGLFGYSRADWRNKDNVHGLANRFLIHRPPWAIDLGGRQGLRLTARGESIIRWLANTEAVYSAPSPVESASD